MNLKYDLITITLNSEKTLQRTLNSVLAQKQLPSRYIFVDAQSKDQTVNIVEKFKEDHPEIEVIVEQQSEKGVSQAWNQALKHTENELICLLNSDDWWLSETMEKVINRFEANPSLEIFSGAILYCRGENDSNPKFMRPKPTWQMPFKMCYMHPATFVKKSVYEKVGGFNENLKCSMDYDFMFRAMQNKIDIQTVKEVFTCMQAGGLANSTRSLARKETRDIALKYSFLLPWISYWCRTLLKR